MVEQPIEWQPTSYLNFIDIRKAFDIIERNAIWKIMQHYDIPDKFVNIKLSFYEDMASMNFRFLVDCITHRFTPRALVDLH